METPRGEWGDLALGDLGLTFGLVAYCVSSDD